MTKTKTAERPELKLIARSMAVMMIIVDLVTVVGWSFDYVLPVLLAFPQAGLIRLLSAIGVLTFLVLIPAFFLPLIVVLFEFPPDEL